MTGTIAAVLRGIAAVVVLTGLGGAVWWEWQVLNSKAPAEKEPEKPSPFVKVEGNETILTFDEDTQRRVGLATKQARAATWRPTRAVYGRVIADPTLTAEVRAPLAGVVRAAEGHAWPVLGERMPGGAELGRIDVRAAPVDRANLAASQQQVTVQLALQARDVEAKVREAVTQLEGAEKVVGLQTRTLERLRRNAGSVTKQELDDAETKLAEAEARVAAARAAAEVWRETAAALKRLSASVPPIEGLTAPLTVPPTAQRDGWEVLESPAHPGESVEAGAVVLRLAVYPTVLVRLELPADLTPPAEASVDVGGGRVLVTRHVGAAPQFDPASQLRGVLYRAAMPAGGPPLRPGLYVTAEVPAGPEAEGVKVPVESVLQNKSRTALYVESGAGRFVRRVVEIDHKDEDWAYVRSGVKAGVRVVTRGASVLLSTEFADLFGADSD